MSIAASYKRLYEGTNHRLRNFAGGRFASWCRPTSIILLLTERCNARCLHCDIWKNRGQEESPSADQWKTVLADLRSWLGPVQVTFSGGEALLKPFTIDLVKFSLSLGLFQEVLTHGWHDQGKIEALALARPWRVTISVDGLGETHDRIRGREHFFDKVAATIGTLQRVRARHDLDFTIRLKTVLMSHNLDDAAKIAEFASQEGMHVFYQPIEQNYNTTENPAWFEDSDNWPRDPEKAVAVVRELVRLKRCGRHIDNSYEQLEAMIPYFRNPDAMRVSVQGHLAHEHMPLCGALTTLQLQANGDVTVCAARKPVGNIKTAPIRQIWEARPRFWENGDCCLLERCTPAEKQARALAAE